jgi:hypothetical protein
MKQTLSLRSGAARRVLGLAASLACLLFASGCATVRAYEREHLADRIMRFDADAKETARAVKTFEAREGSTGGSGGSGGGCACN